MSSFFGLCLVLLAVAGCIYFGIGVVRDIIKRKNKNDKPPNDK